jgi:hypothetical protein
VSDIEEIPVPGDAQSPLDVLMDREGAMWRTFALPEQRVFFVQVNKNACTSLKWMLAGVAGEDLKAFAPSLHASTSEQDDIHDRKQWQVVPRLDAMTPEQRAQIHPDNGWFVFAVTRDPRSRLFSAWQSKLLLENPGYTRYRGEHWYPRHPLTADTVVADFAKFVALFERQPHLRIRRDAHFCDQVNLLHLDAVTYTKIYDIRELDMLLTDLQRHLDSVGWHGQLQLPRLNDTPLAVNAQPFGDGIRERIEKLYAADFELFGDRWDFGRVEQQSPWTDQALHEAEWHAIYGRRIGYLREEALTFRAKFRIARERKQVAKARAEKLKARVLALKAQSSQKARS